MKKALVILAALACTTLSTSFGQSRPAAASPAKSPEQQADRRAQYLTRQLGLSAEQAAKVEPILQAQAQELQQLKDKYPAGSRKGLGPELKAAQAKYDEQLRAVLTPEQFTKLEQLRSERRDNMRERRQSR